MKRMSGILLALCAAAAFAASPKDVAGKQIDLCMIGDSITWYGKGDCYRAEALKALPNLAFIGTHTAFLGYSHAGEGGDNLWGLAKRIHDVKRIPDCRYYHLLMGVNNCAGTKTDAEAPKRAAGIAKKMHECVGILLKRPGCEKVFVGTIFPCVSDNPKAKPAEVEKYRLRDLTAQEVNKIIRKDLPASFGDKVVIIEYEKPLRARADWKQIIRLHPTPAGYAVVGPMLADAVRRHAVPENKPLTKFGVEVTNLWDAKLNAIPMVLPGWYCVSFDVAEVRGGKLTFTLQSRSGNGKKYKFPFKKAFSIPAKAGQRVQFTFFTGYEGYGYSRSDLEFAGMNGSVTKVLVEKMRPTQKASVYGTGTYVDGKSPMSLGEKFVLFE